eukprot:4189108-Amphidinium_carterae.2
MTPWVKPWGLCDWMAPTGQALRHSLGGAECTLRKISVQCVLPGSRSDEGTHGGNFHQAYVVGGKIWQGETAQVRTVKKEYAVEDLSVRIVDLRKQSTKGDTDEVDPGLKKKASMEKLVWSRVGRHENIVRLLEIIWDGPLAYMVWSLVALRPSASQSALLP